MFYLLVRHKVRAIEKWKAAFDAHEEARAQAGMRTRFLSRNIDDPNKIIRLFEASDREKFGNLRARAT
jgi:hypothetical protein